MSCATMQGKSMGLLKTKPGVTERLAAVSGLKRWVLR